MKHIFMGKINYIDYDFVCEYKINGYLYAHLEIESLEDFNKFIEDFWKGKLEPRVSKVEYEFIKETTDIQERISGFSKVKVNDEELKIEKIVQCDNGDVICYTSKVLKEIENEGSKKIAEELKDKCYKVFEEYKLNKEQEVQQNNKKWWQFWR